jgi:hypothetical protein
MVPPYHSPIKDAEARENSEKIQGVLQEVIRVGNNCIAAHIASLNQTKMKGGKQQKT